MKPSIILVTGCARSGTTGLTHLLNASENVFVGHELYHRRYVKDPASVTADLFSAEQLTEACRLKKDLSKTQAEDLLKKVSGCGIIGDKSPHYVHGANELLSRIPNSKMVAIVRDPVAVARSYEMRNADPNDKWKWGADKAKMDWDRATEQLLNVSKEVKNKLTIIEYDWIFGVRDYETFLLRAELIWKEALGRIAEMEDDERERVCAILSRTRQKESSRRQLTTTGLGGGFWSEHSEREGRWKSLKQLTLKDG